MNDLRCYVCGKPLEQGFYLFSMREDVDRCFLAHGGDCLELVKDECAVVVEVQRVLR